MEIDTKIFKIGDNFSDNEILEAGNIIKNGGLVAFPTETVYGLGAGIYHENAILDIFKAKGRPADNPLIVHIADKADIADICSDMTDSAHILAEHFMPGPITLVMKKKSNISKNITAGLDTVAVRMPEHPVARALIRLSGEPIAAPSANLSGKPSPTEAKHVIEDMNGRIDAIIAAGNCRAGVESTVVDVTGDVPVILRPGVVTYEDICALIPNAAIDRHVIEQVEVGETPKSPGMKYKHYAPDAEVIVVEGCPEAVSEKIKRLREENRGITTGVISYFNTYDGDNVLSAGDNAEEYAHNLFSLLRIFDELGVKKVFAEFREEGGCSLAVQNRLYKSAGYNIIHV